METTVGKFKRLLKLLDDCVAVVNRAGYDEAVDGLKSLQFELCKALARENEICDLLQHELGMNYDEFFRYMFPVIERGDFRGARNYYEEFPEERDDFM